MGCGLVLKSDGGQVDSLLKKKKKGRTRMSPSTNRAKEGRKARSAHVSRRGGREKKKKETIFSCSRRGGKTALPLSFRSASF